MRPSLEEIREAVESCESSKSTSYDGFDMCLLKVCGKTSNLIVVVLFGISLIMVSSHLKLI